MFHVMIGAQGEFTSVEPGLATALKAAPGSLIGRHVLDVTAPADRTECEAALAKLSRDGLSFAITKRLLCDDGSLIWARNHVSSASGVHGIGTLIASIEVVTDQAAHDRPAVLLACARFLKIMGRARAAVIEAIFLNDAAWETVLETYVAEAEGRSNTMRDIAAATNQSDANAIRWINALLQEGILEIEYREPSRDADKSFRLTGATHKRLEIYLATYDEAVSR